MSKKIQTTKKVAYEKIKLMSRDCFIRKLFKNFINNEYYNKNSFSSIITNLY